MPTLSQFLQQHLAEHHLPAGARGVIVDIYGQDKYEVEFVGENGETFVLLALNGQTDFKNGSSSERLPES